MTGTAQQLAYWGRKAREATEKRDALIRQMRDEGGSLRVIAEAAGISHTAVKKILVRGETPVAAL